MTLDQRLEQQIQALCKHLGIRFVIEECSKKHASMDEIPDCSECNVYGHACSVEKI